LIFLHHSQWWRGEEICAICQNSRN
jgi:hypothetical protein